MTTAEKVPDSAVREGNGGVVDLKGIQRVIGAADGECLGRSLKVIVCEHAVAAGVIGSRTDSLAIERSTCITVRAKQVGSVFAGTVGLVGINIHHVAEMDQGVGRRNRAGATDRCRCAGTGIQHVVAIAALQSIGTGSTGQRIVAGTTNQDVVTFAADEVAAVIMRGDRVVTVCRR